MTVNYNSAFKIEPTKREIYESMTVLINGKKYKVDEKGAVVGYFELNPGEVFYIKHGDPAAGVVSNRKHTPAYFELSPQYSKYHYRDNPARLKANGALKVLDAKINELFLPSSEHYK